MRTAVARAPAERIAPVIDLADARRRAKAKHKAIVKRARVDPIAFAEYVIVHEITQKPIVCAEIHKEWHRYWSKHDWSVLVAPVESGKAMPLDTPVATPSGWVPIGQIRTGDVVYGRDGRPYAVSKAHDYLHDREVYEFEFDDGGTVRSDLDHLWLAWHIKDLDSQRAPRVVTTREIVESGVKRGRDFRWKIPVSDAVQYPERSFSVHPYVLGVWLGDGTSANAQLTVHEDDYEIAERCLAIEGATAEPQRDKRSPKVLRVNLGGSTSKRDNLAPNRLRKRLRDLGVSGNKHIPAEYLLGSVEQRRELLAGLLDTDGSVSRMTGGSSRVEFCSVIERLATETLELVRSLGFKATMKAKRLPKGNYVYRVCFTAREPVFKLKRKLDKQILDGDRTRTRHRTIVAVRKCERQTTRCLSVASPDHTFIVGRDYTVTHNTTQLVARLLFEMGRNRDVRIAIISEGEEQAFKVLGQIRRYIEESKRLHEVFPELKRSSRAQHLWNQHAIEIERSPYLRDPTIRVYGAGTRIAGARLDIIVCDDILSPQNTGTLEQSQKVINWFDVVVLTRAQDDPEGGPTARVWVIGTPFVDHDILHELPKRKSWVGRIYCAVKNPDDLPTAWVPTLPTQWPIKRLLKRLNGMLPSAFARKYLCRVVNNINSRFPDWVIKRALTLGRGLTMQKTQPLIWPGPRKLKCFTGVDFGIGEKEGDDLTAMVTVALRDDKQRQVVQIESGHWTADEIVERLVETHYRYDSRLIVESVAAQKWMMQFTRKKKKIPIEPYNTTAQSKWDEAFGIESIAVELRQGLWIFPSGEKGDDVDAELAALRLEMVGYGKEKHTGDRLMALWFAREGIRRFLGKHFA